MGGEDISLIRDCSSPYLMKFWVLNYPVSMANGEAFVDILRHGITDLHCISVSCLGLILQIHDTAPIYLTLPCGVMVSDISI